MLSIAPTVAAPAYIAAPDRATIDVLGGSGSAGSGGMLTSSAPRLKPWLTERQVLVKRSPIRGKTRL
jgi:hypothetical protein